MHTLFHNFLLVFFNFSLSSTLNLKLKFKSSDKLFTVAKLHRKQKYFLEKKLRLEFVELLPSLRYICVPPVVSRISQLRCKLSFKTGIN